jgi:hypothetical protein
MNISKTGVYVLLIIIIVLLAGTFLASRKPWIAFSSEMPLKIIGTFHDLDS